MSSLGNMVGIRQRLFDDRMVDRARAEPRHRSDSDRTHDNQRVATPDDTSLSFLHIHLRCRHVASGLRKLNKSNGQERSSVSAKEEVHCGPSSLMMVMSALDQRYQPNETAELEIWREATTIHDGCGPVGLALALKRRASQPS
ncbi:peptidase C39 family protein [Bradyrhizobium sp. IC3069]|uniref:peptidase C39 family protein n=1 Tax=Bradyrhizobium sp. IC4059 TaxID=2793805 RepID=UPI00201C5180|nr:peptidase C39 family protein [Bradyrhizobium sp. IC4059]MCA1360827.1 peptidase C39 family protein [Bradyrhizobium sp. IC4059]MCA1518375.1 peptidase C39 family protein [Bradyrhizobium sp. IC3069]